MDGQITRYRSSVIPGMNLGLKVLAAGGGGGRSLRMASGGGEEITSLDE